MKSINHSEHGDDSVLVSLIPDCKLVCFPKLCYICITESKLLSLFKKLYVSNVFSKCSFHINYLFDRLKEVSCDLCFVMDLIDRHVSSYKLCYCKNAVCSEVCRICKNLVGRHIVKLCTVKVIYTDLKRTYRFKHTLFKI